MPTKTLTAKNLETLGAPRLAELLMELASRDAAVGRRLRLALAGEAGPAEMARQVNKRLSTLAKARSFIERNRIKPLAEELRAQHRAIVDVVGKSDARQALELLWRFVELADPTLERCDDSDGRLASVFETAARDLAPLAAAARPDPEALADAVFAAIGGDGYGQFDGLIADMAPTLGPAGLARLKQRLAAWRDHSPKPATGEREIIGFGLKGPLYADDFEARRREHVVREALAAIADAENDVDSFIAQFDPAARRIPGVAATIAERLLAAGRAEDAWRSLEAADAAGAGPDDAEWRQARIDVAEALGRADEAQALRWSGFAETLESDHLRAYLARLPDFDDVEAEDRAMALAVRFADVHMALDFLVGWPAPGRANELVQARYEELNGGFHEVLAPAAEALEGRHPLAATLLRRAMIDFTLGAARASRYRHAARHLAECAADATRIADFGAHPAHADYVRGLKLEHGRKWGFWNLVA